MPSRPLILIADDETRIRRLVVQHLETAGFDVCQAQDGSDAIEVFKSSPIEPDLVILDLMMPEMDGHETLQALRTFSDVPVLILTARDLLSDKAKSFKNGADDYLIKPFAFEELELRIRALLRRSRPAQTTSRIIENGPLQLRNAEHDLFWRGIAVPLTEQEFRLLSALALHPGAVLRYAELIRHGWGQNDHVDVSRLRVAIARIRKKLATVGINPMIISSFTNVGYLMGDLSNYDEEFSTPTD